VARALINGAPVAVLRLQCNLLCARGQCGAARRRQRRRQRRARAIPCRRDSAYAARDTRESVPRARARAFAAKRQSRDKSDTVTWNARQLINHPARPNAAAVPPSRPRHVPACPAPRCNDPPEGWYAECIGMRPCHRPFASVETLTRRSSLARALSRCVIQICLFVRPPERLTLFELFQSSFLSLSLSLLFVLFALSHSLVLISDCIVQQWLSYWDCHRPIRPLPIAPPLPPIRFAYRHCLQIRVESRVKLTGGGVRFDPGGRWIRSRRKVRDRACWFSINYYLPRQVVGINGCGVPCNM